MILLRREYRDGAEPPEIVLLHAEVAPMGEAAGPPRRFIRVAVPSDVPGRRLAFLPLPEPGEGVTVRYRFSTVRGGEERFSPPYEVAVPSDDVIADLYRLPEEGTGNLPPAPGRGHFRMVLPLGEGERASGTFRFGFGAMRKKPSPALCRAAIDAGNGPAPVVEVPEALSVLKNRPMPFFLYHVSADGKLRADKIACARIAFPDPAGEIVSARIVWGDPAWRATNLSLMEPREKGAGRSRLPAPRGFEAFVYGPSGYVVEYCFLIVARRPDGGLEARWRNREGGGNWVVTL